MMFQQAYRLPLITTTCRRRSSGFTLVELLVVMMLLLMLAAIGLPTVKKLIKDQKTSQTARNVVAYLEGARSRAIATGQPVGVVFERAGAGDYVSRSYSIRMRMMRGLPPYAGESESSVATLFHSPYDPANTTSQIVNAALFDPSDNPLLFLSAQNGGGAGSPIRIGARLEVQNGRSVRINSIGFAANPDPLLPGETANSRTAIKVTFDPRQAISSRVYSGVSYGYPAGLVQIIGTQSVPFRIHRLPTPSNVDSFELLRGMAVDLNYAGIGPDGTHFAPATIDSGSADASGVVNFQPVTVMFSPDGSVEFCSWGLGNVDERPAGNVFFLLGKAEQVALAPDVGEWFLSSERERSNLMDLESIWITINPNNGNVYSSPVASISGISSLAATGPASLGPAVLQSRQYAMESDTISSN